MVTKGKRLGRGLEALLGRVGGEEHELDQPEISSSVPSNSGSEVDADWMLQQRLASQTPHSIDIMLIDRNPYQPRLEFDEAELEQLAQSLIVHGLLQPIVVRKVGERFQIIAGERRFRAAMRAGWSEVPVHCLTVGDREMIELALTENMQRKDLNAIEKAISFANYLETYGGTHEELAKRLELDRSTVTNLLRLLDLPQKLQDAVRKEKLTQGHVRALLPLEEQEQIEAAERIQLESWSVRETERYVRELIENGQPNDFNDSNNSKDGWQIVDQNGNKQPINRPGSQQSEQIIQLEQDFRERLGGVQVKLTQSNEKGKGKLVISFTNHAEFEQIYAVICRNYQNSKAATA
ncbi:MAG: ParB/RepB/Spo0J family partition protein [Planctomycetaceae bacterium]|nr:ParB/RepB/Spo0J family partition protein [Planctomycetaceae bacterium]